MEQYNPAKLRLDYQTLESGEPRMRAMRAACTAAERAGDYESALLFHHDLIKESVFSGDRYQALIDFPQYLALVRSKPDLEEAHMWDTLWMFKWIVEAAAEFYQIEKKQVLQWLSEFRRSLTRQGYSLKPFYAKRMIFYNSCGERAKLRLDYDAFLHASSDAMSDGEADEYNTIVRWELALGNREKALRAAEHIFSKRLHTEEIPAVTYGHLLCDAMQHGDTAEAAHYAALLEPMCTNRFRLEQIGVLLGYEAQANPERGLQFLRRHAALREGSRNPHLCFCFDRGAAALLNAAAAAGLDDPAALRAEAAQCLASAQELAAKFDARGGSDYYSAQCIGIS